MSTLQAEFDRLYRTGATQPGTTRVLVLELARPAEWDVLAALWRGVQTDLEWPAPAIAVNGTDGFQLWFSVASPLPMEQAQTVLEVLRARYLDALPRARLRLSPPADLSTEIPALQGDSGHWSAFVAPDLARIFSDEPWLDLPPSPDAQASLLARLQSIPLAALHAVLQQHPPADTPPQPSEAGAPATAPTLEARQPLAFLHEVMNHPGIALHLRIEAAKALLPYSQGSDQTLLK